MKLCGQCGVTLNGRRMKFCSDLCKSRFHDGYGLRPIGFRNRELARKASAIANGRPEDRFWERVHKTETCWLWIGQKDGKGYGHMKVRGRATQAHRYSLELHGIVIPPGMFACHHCDTPACVNPSHLFVGTAGDNSRDRNQKGRAASKAGELNGRAKLTAEQVAEIRRTVAGGSVRQVDMARLYGVAGTQISRIINGYAWVVPA